jgi:hypothetical protein
MHWYRKLSITLASFFFGLSLFLFALFFIFNFTFASPQFIKRSLDSSQFYNNIVSEVLALASSDPLKITENAGSDSTITQIKPIIQRIVTPEFLKTNTESVIDSFYKWLNGKVKKPNISIDINPARAQINSEVVSYMRTRLDQLPYCQGANIPSSIDIFNTTCKPGGEISTQNLNENADSIIDGLPLLNNGKLSLDASLPTSNFDKMPLKYAPTVFKISKIAPVIFGVLLVLFGVTIFWLSKNNYRAVKIIGHSFISSGGLLIVSGALIIINNRYGFGLFSKATPAQADFMDNIFIPLFKNISTSISNWALNIGVAYVVIGGIFYFIHHQIKRKLSKAQEQSPPQETTPPELVTPDTVAPKGL